jgi:hypothetical protein
LFIQQAITCYCLCYGNIFLCSLFYSCKLMICVGLLWTCVDEW